MVIQKRQPFFYDTTLRDGNQALKKPWNTQEKIEIFNHLLNLGVQAVEVGFAAASDMDYEACTTLSEMSEGKTVISALARTVDRDILKASGLPSKLDRARVPGYKRIAKSKLK